MKYFIGNWKMFGVPRSINILNKINSFRSRDKNRNKYRIIITPPYTLIESFAKQFRNKKIIIGSQNCYQKDQFSSNTAAVSPYMIKSVNAKYTLIGHSERRIFSHESNKIISKKLNQANNNSVMPILCIGESAEENERNDTHDVLKFQIDEALKDHSHLRS